MALPPLSLPEVIMEGRNHSKGFMIDPLAACLAQAGAKAKEGTSLIQPVVAVELFMTQTSVRQVASDWCPELDVFIQTVPEEVWLEAFGFCLWPLYRQSSLWRKGGTWPNSQTFRAGGPQPTTL